MPEIRPDVPALLSELAEEFCLVEPLGFPEIACLGVRTESLLSALESNLAVAATEADPGELQRRLIAGPPELRAVVVDLSPPRRGVRWRKPVRLTVRAAVWRHGDEAFVATVPALGIEVFAETAEALADRLAPHIRAALARQGLATRLPGPAAVERFAGLELGTLRPRLAIQSPRQAAVEAGRDRPGPSVLKEAAEDLTARRRPAVYELDDAVARIADALTGAEPRSVLLVGPSGVGKTAAVHRLVARRAELGLPHTPFFATSGARLVAGMSGFGMWQERCTRLIREAAASKAVLYVGPLVELMQVGRSLQNHQGIAGFLRPYLARGEIQVIAECTPEQLPLIERDDPHLPGVFERIELGEPPPPRARAILSARNADGAELGPSLDESGLDALDRLHRRYAGYSAYPGRPLRFLENLLKDRADLLAEVPPWDWAAKGAPGPRDRRLNAADVTAAFARQTGLPLFLLDPAARLDLEHTRRFFAERVVGQPEAVSLITDLLASVKAGLTRPRRPIAGLMFIGPTGVGKTEMAKALAEFLFGDRRRLTRFDMSEYADESSVQRLIGGVFGAEGLLTARVREQPFSVVLLDEFEKAHPAFADLLLQVLGEGRLTDAGGRVADFCNTVVILTSNLGAESFRRGRPGFAKDRSGRASASAHFTEALRDAVRPELFNRIDRVVGFEPLSEDTVRAIAGRELDLIRRRDGLRFRSVQLAVAEPVVARLAAKGYDPQYGARPLKRAIERELLVPLAEGLNAFGEDAALTAEVSLSAARPEVTVRARTDDEGRTISAAAAAGDIGGLTAACRDLRRRVQRLERGPTVLELTNEVFAAERLEKRLALKGGWTNPRDAARLKRLQTLKRIAETLKTVSFQAVALEDEALLALYESRPFRPEAAGAADPAAVEAQWDGLLMDLLCLRYDRPDEIVLGVFGEERSLLMELAAAYRGAAVAADGAVRVIAFVAGRTGRADASSVVYAVHPDGRAVVFVDGQVPEDDSAHRASADAAAREQLPALSDPAKFLRQPPEGVVGVALQVSGPAAQPRFEGEHGLHVFALEDKKHTVAVTAFAGAPDKFVPPAGIDRRGGWQPGGDRCRSYDVAKREFTDAATGKSRFWSTEELGRFLAERLRAAARAIAEE